jgi:hypothetical protein
VGLKAVDDVQRLLTHAQAAEIPEALRRRAGSDSAFRSALTRVQESMQEIHRYALEVSGGNADELRRARVDLTLELSSILFAAGAPHPRWRWWARQAADALLEYDEPSSAAVWAVLAHDDELVGRLPEAPEPGHDPGHVVWWVAGRRQGRPTDPAGEPKDHVNTAWTMLARSIPAREHPATGRALRTIADFWMNEDEDWESFHPGYYPEFEPELNAAATLARRLGWEPVDWPPDTLRFLEPALADVEASAS